jgi:nicotinamide-nucleotide amidase
VKAALLSIGDELLVGQVVNTNATWLASKCTELGITVLTVSTVGDGIDMIVEEIRRLMTLADVVITTGGLGPTHDDLTDEAILALAGASTVSPLPNNVGTAPGMLCEREGAMVIAMPGVPIEMKRMAEEVVLPMLSERIEEDEDVWQYRVVQTTAIGESKLAGVIGPVSDFLGTSTLAFLPNYHGVRLRVGARGASREVRQHELQRVIAEIKSRAGKYIYAEGETSLAETVGRLLKIRGETVAVAESCTGGLLGGAFTDVAGSSAWFEGGIISYSNAVKENELGVSHDVLQTHGAVSEEAARAMAEGVRHRLSSTWGIGITGVAGPDGGTEEKPVGTVWISVSGPRETMVRRFTFGTDRTSNRARSVGAALAMLWKQLV